MLNNFKELKKNQSLNGQQIFVTASFISQANIQSKHFEYLLHAAVFKEKQETNNQEAS